MCVIFIAARYLDVNYFTVNWTATSLRFSHLVLAAMEEGVIKLAPFIGWHTSVCQRFKLADSLSKFHPK